MRRLLPEERFGEVSSWERGRPARNGPKARRCPAVGETQALAGRR